MTDREPKTVGTIPELTRWGETFHNVAVVTSFYLDNERPAVLLTTGHNEVLAKVSVNLPDYPPLQPGWFYAANYSETEGLPEALRELGVLELRDRVDIPVGPHGAGAKVARLTAAYGGRDY